jgi:hypothetical protein
MTVCFIRYTGYQVAILRGEESQFKVNLPENYKLRGSGVHRVLAGYWRVGAGGFADGP